MSLVNRTSPGSSRQETTGSPRFPGSPWSRVVLFDPGGKDTSRPFSRGILVAFHVHHVSAPAFEYFEVQSHNPRPRCVRFAAGVTPEPRNTRYRLAWPHLAGRDFHPLGFIAEFPGFTGPSVSPFPTGRACLAHGADPLSSLVDSVAWKRFCGVLENPYLAPRRPLFACPSPNAKLRNKKQTTVNRKRLARCWARCLFPVSY
jgi:hypothetical protein